MSSDDDIAEQRRQTALREVETRRLLREAAERRREEARRDVERRIQERNAGNST